MIAGHELGQRNNYVVTDDSLGSLISYCYQVGRIQTNNAIQTRLFQAISALIFRPGKSSTMVFAAERRAFRAELIDVLISMLILNHTGRRKRDNYGYD